MATNRLRPFSLVTHDGATAALKAIRDDVLAATKLQAIPATEAKAIRDAIRDDLAARLEKIIDLIERQRAEDEARIAATEERLAQAMVLLQSNLDALYQSMQIEIRDKLDKSLARTEEIVKNMPLRAPKRTTLTEKSILYDRGSQLPATIVERTTEQDA